MHVSPVVNLVIFCNSQTSLSCLYFHFPPIFGRQQRAFSLSSMLLLGMVVFWPYIWVNACVLSLLVSQYTRTRGFFKIFVRCQVRVTSLSPGSYVHYVFPLSPLFFPRHLQLATIRASCKVGRSFSLRLNKSFYIMLSQPCRTPLPMTDMTPFLTKQFITRSNLNDAQLK